MKPRFLAVPLIVVASIFACGASAQPGGSGRLSLFGSGQTLKFDDGTSRDFTEFTAAISYRTLLREDDDGFEYSLDARGTEYSSSARTRRTRLYDAWIGGRMAGGRLTIRGGQMWLHDLGALGSVGGVMTEYSGEPAAIGRVRFGLFAGGEPKSFETGYAPHVRKGGAWVALESGSLRRHVLGYVTTRNSGLTERSALTTTNFVPIGDKFFLYQLAVYDFEGPGGLGDGGGLNYFFANARYTPARTVEFMANVHRGRSIDTRTITEDILNGRAVDQKLLDGFLYESVGGRVTVEVLRNVRVHAGYASDRHNRDDRSFGRISAGVWAANVAGSGVDLTFSDNRSERAEGSYDSWYVSIGRGIGAKVYVTVDYATSLAVIRVIDDGVAVERHPRSKRYGFHGVWNVSRVISFLATLERLHDDTSNDERGTFGLIYRF
ncbi:MAG TPA: hypothetical protein VF787_07955 [Thermoanaerobaculia bacterium]